MICKKHKKSIKKQIKVYQAKLATGKSKLNPIEIPCTEPPSVFVPRSWAKIEQEHHDLVTPDEAAEIELVRAEAMLSEFFDKA